MEDKKKKRAIKRKDGSTFIELNPTMNEARAETAVVTFGRFNPPHKGHEKLINKVIAEAKARKAIPLVYASHTKDKKKNPLPYDSKIKYLKMAFGRAIRKSNARTIIEVAKELSGRYNNLVVVVGSDRVQEFKLLLTKYNGHEYNYKTIEVVSAGERDPDSDGVSGMSASKLRALAAEGDFDSFRRGLPLKLSSVAEKIYEEIRSNMGIEEEFGYEEGEQLDERQALNVQQRRARGRTMRRYKSKLAAARRRARRRKASPDKLKQRARKKARALIRQRFLQGRNYNELSAAEKMQVDKRVLRIPDTIISRIATRQLPKVRQAEMQRLSTLASGGSTKKESFNEAFESFLNERRECPPKRNHMAFTKEGKVKFDRRFKFFRKSLDEDFMDDARDLMEEVEYFVENEKLDKSKDDPCWKGYVQLGMKKKGKGEVPNCVPMESSNPADREEGTDSLVRIYKKDTPGQNRTESYYDSTIPAFDFRDFERGSRVKFTSHSMDMADDGSEKEGTVVGSNVQHLRVRSDDGMLYKVRHADAELVSSPSGNM